MRTREVAEICGVTDRTVTGNAAKAGVVLENGKVHDWTEEEVKKLQLVLMNNAQNNNANASEQVKEASKTVFKLGTLANVALMSGNIEAAEQFSKLLIQATAATAEAKKLEEQNKLLIEERNAALQETEDIKQYNKNFHNELFTTTEIANRLGISANYIGRLTNKLHLKQEPIWGKLGKVQLNNGKWVDQFYYNEDAVKAIEAQF